MTKKILFLPTILTLLFFLGAKFPAQAQEAQYVGSDTCLDCHDDIYNRIIRTPHFSASLQKAETRVESCEACHGPGGIHTEDPEVKGSIRNFQDLSSAESAAICLSCHQADHFLMYFKREKHYQSGDSCLSCHSMHPRQPLAKLIAQRPEKLCFSCHQEKVAEFNLPYHHKIAEGRMTCWSCHDPHNTETSPQTIGVRKIDENCFTCHPSKRGPFTYEHLGTNVGTCEVCHLPHGSENARLLRRSTQSFLCLECHSGPSLSDSLLGTKTPSFHITTKATYQNCTVCHTKIHGSYLDHYFLR
ncbi:MAG: DmsE family decaheme c-type cytochrome [Candidatus Aminicenantales bacterium]